MPNLRQIRLATGLVLYVYVALHFANHALGNISIGAMESGLAIQKLIWQSAPGAAILYIALLTHMSLGFWALYARRRFDWTCLEAAQLILGLAIPFLLTSHLIATCVALSQFGLEKGYAQELVSFWVTSPLLGALQAVLLLVVWIHGCLGVHFWLRLKRCYPRAKNLMLVGAVLLPALALLGYYQGGERALMAVQDPAWRARILSPEYAGDAAQNAVLLNERIAIARLPGCRARRHALRPGLPTMERAPSRLDPADLSRSHGSRGARLQRLGSKPHQRHPACACVRRPWPLLDLPYPRPWRCRGLAGCERRRASGAGARACSPGGQARLPASPDPRHRGPAHALSLRDDRRRLSNRGGRFGGRALCRDHVCRHARIEPAGRKASAVRHRVHHQPVSQCREQRGVERGRRAQPGAGRRALGPVRDERPARCRLPSGDRRQRRDRRPSSRASTRRSPMRLSSRSALASAFTRA